jgi:transcriptional regulator with XRE-family HTH domain
MAYFGVGSAAGVAASTLDRQTVCPRRGDWVFGDVVRANRARLGMTQEELAGKAGVGVRSIRDIEAGRVGRPRPGTVRLLADAFALRDTARDRFHESALVAQLDEPAPGRPVPAQLPADVAGFTGRTGYLGQLDALLGIAVRPPATVVIAGTAGVGKTALAVHWAHQVRHRFPDGQLYVNLRGFDHTATPTDPGAVVRRFLDALYVPAHLVPADPDAQAALYRTLLADRRMLVLLDNARDSEQVRPLLPGASGCLVLITSRSELTGLIAAEGARALPVDLLTSDEAHELFARRVGADRFVAEPRAFAEIVAHCARLPLALAIAAARATAHPHLPLAALAADLCDSHDRLDALTTDDTGTGIRAVFSWSYRTLSLDAARLFRLLGLHPGPEVTARSAASLTRSPPAQVRPLLAELARAHLLTEHAPGRYAFHDLLGDYATEQATLEHPPTAA